MAELTGEFLIERLSSRQLLALLFVCECRRKKTIASLSFQGGEKPAAWAEFVDRFGARLAKLPEAERGYLIGSHLQSAEEVDIYSNAELGELLDTYRDTLALLVRELEQDARLSSPA
jgi:hypothetical protein